MTKLKLGRLEMKDAVELVATEAMQSMYNKYDNLKSSNWKGFKARLSQVAEYEEHWTSESNSKKKTWFDITKATNDIEDIVDNRTLKSGNTNTILTFKTHAEKIISRHLLRSNADIITMTTKQIARLLPVDLYDLDKAKYDLKVEGYQIEKRYINYFYFKRQERMRQAIKSILKKMEDNGAIEVNEKIVAIDKQDVYLKLETHVADEIRNFWDKNKKAYQETFNSSIDFDKTFLSTSGRVQEYIENEEIFYSNLKLKGAFISNEITILNKNKLEESVNRSTLEMNIKRFKEEYVAYNRKSLRTRIKKKASANNITMYDLPVSAFNYSYDFGNSKQVAMHNKANNELLKFIIKD